MCVWKNAASLWKCDANTQFIKTTLKMFEDRLKENDDKAIGCELQWNGELIFKIQWERESEQSNHVWWTRGCGNVWRRSRWRQQKEPTQAQKKRGKKTNKTCRVPSIYKSILCCGCVNVCPAFIVKIGSIYLENCRITWLQARYAWQTYSHFTYANAFKIYTISAHISCSRLACHLLENLNEQTER